MEEASKEWGCIQALVLQLAHASEATDAPARELRQVPEGAAPVWSEGAAPVGSRGEAPAGGQVGGAPRKILTK